MDAVPVVVCGAACTVPPTDGRTATPLTALSLYLALVRHELMSISSQH
jgi:hypothetical protein